MLLFTLANERQRRSIQHNEGPIEFGRLQQGQCARIVVDDPFTSRDQLRIEELPTGDIRVANLGSPVTLPDGTQLNVGAARRFTPPVRLVFGCSTLEVGLIPSADAPSTGMQTIARPAGGDTGSVKQIFQKGGAPAPEVLAQWFEALLNVQRAAPGSNEFYADTARAVVELIGLDRGLVILRRRDVWEVIGSCSAANEGSQTKADNRQFSQRVLLQVLAEKRTFYQSFQETGAAQSLMGIEAVVASPVFDEKNAVVGVVYGSRDMRTATGHKGITPLEAQFLQVLAGAVSTGLSRLAREADAARARVQFEQFFSPELARALERDAQILAAQQRELTLLFADLRGFSKIAERIGAKETYQLLADILDRLTNQVMDHGGVVIDYYGDGLAAMWNAPTDTPHHAQRGVQAALAMQGELPAINSVWAEKLGGLIRLGLGLHTGTAQIGNSGSRRRLKYGPRGHAVNLTSRVEAATKVFGVACLMTGATRASLRQPVPLRRVCRGRLTGMSDPVDLFELGVFSDHPTWLAQRDKYEAALALYERQNPSECLAACRAFQAEFGVSDGPTNWLLKHAEQRHAAGDESYDPVFSVETK
ncbi:MAG TPA: adenylate/guanylate cyclase domain-containing protein [Pirellulaceae bacterium]|nr:adenylate/guanylate cyclase domain-containing protein [Pirellulaceae bacterium]